MHIHFNTLSHTDIYRAAGIAGVDLESQHYSGSRTHGRKITLRLSGNSPYRGNFGADYQAATWDQWGIFLNELYEVDPTIVAGDYSSRELFELITCGRFSEHEWRDNPCRCHKWEYNNTDYLYCKKCSAQQYRHYGPHAVAQREIDALVKAERIEQRKAQRVGVAA